MPYIDKDKLIKELSTMYKTPASTEDFMTVGYDHAIADVVVIVHEQPTADVQEVVTCKDCTHGIPTRIDTVTGVFRRAVLQPSPYVSFRGLLLCRWKRKETEDVH